MSLARASYRSRQFFAALAACLPVGGARLTPAERETIAARLTPEQQRLFFAMAVPDQRHSLDVFYALERRGCREEEVLLAALLHDIGKGPVRLWQRVAYVLLKAISPRLLDRLAQPDGQGWRLAMASLRDHGARGAALAKGVGVASPIVELIRHHETADITDRRLALLRAADESC